MRNQFETNKYSFPQKGILWNIPKEYPLIEVFVDVRKNMPFQKYCRHFHFLRTYSSLWKTEKFKLVHAGIRCFPWSVCQQGTGLQRALGSRRPHVDWEMRFCSDFTQVSKKGGFISEIPVTCGYMKISLQIQLLVPVGAAVSQQIWNSGCFIFRKLNEHLALLKFWPWPNTL